MNTRLEHKRSQLSRSFCDESKLPLSDPVPISSVSQISQSLGLVPLSVISPVSTDNGSIKDDDEFDLCTDCPSLCRCVSVLSKSAFGLIVTSFSVGIFHFKYFFT